jgi:hypothetical protein
MILKYSDGTQREAVLLSRSEHKMRVAVAGSEDVTELAEAAGIWVSDDSEPVRVEFAWQRQTPLPAMSEADCVCPSELARHLIDLQGSGTDDGWPRTKAELPNIAAGSDSWPMNSCNDFLPHAIVRKDQRNRGTKFNSRRVREYSVRMRGAR